MAHSGSGPAHANDRDDYNAVWFFFINHVHGGVGTVVSTDSHTSWLRRQSGHIGPVQCGNDLGLGHSSLLHSFDGVFVKGKFGFAQNLHFYFQGNGHGNRPLG